MGLTSLTTSTYLDSALTGGCTRLSLQRHEELWYTKRGSDLDSLSILSIARGDAAHQSPVQFSTSSHREARLILASRMIPLGGGGLILL